MFDAGAVVAKLTLDRSDFEKSLQSITNATARIGKSFQKVGQDIQQVSRQLSVVARNTAFFGTAITGGLVAAFKSAEKYSNSVRQEMERLNNIFIAFRVSIAEALLPVMHRLSNVLADLLNRWNALSPQMREAILRMTFMSGVVLLLGGTIAGVVLKIWQMIGALGGLLGRLLTFASVHPVILGITAGIIALGYAITKFNLAVPILNAVEIATTSLAIAINQLMISVLSAVKIGLQSVDYLGIITGKIQKYAIDTMNTLQELNTQYWVQIQNIFKNGKGIFAQGYNDLKETIDSIVGLFRDLGNIEIRIPQIMESIRTFSEGLRDGLNKSIRSLMDWGTTAENIVVGVVNNMRNMFSDFFYNVFKGQLDDAMDVFAEFGNYILKTIAQIIADIIVLKIAAGFGNLFAPTANIANMGKVLIAPAGYAGFAEGTDRVPYTGMYKVHEGEKVIPKYDASKEQVIQLEIVNLFGDDIVAASLQRRKSAAAIINVVNQDSLRNGIIRREVKHR